MEIFRQLSRKLKIVFVVLAVVALAGIVSSGLLLKKVNSLSAVTPDSQLDVQKTVDEVGQYILLPQDETPTLLTITDLNQLKDQPFFANALIGDKVLVYTTAKKVVLWRPSIHKIIGVSALELNAPK